MSETVKLGDVADVVAGVGFPKDMQGRVEGEIPVFKVGDISRAWTAGERVLRTCRNYLTVDEALMLGRPVPAGSTVFAKIGEALRLNRRAVLGQPSLVDNNVMGLVPRAGTVAPMYLFYFMQTVDLGKLSRATAVPSIRKSDVVEIPMPLPSLDEQAGVVAELEKQFSRLDEAVASLKRVKANLKRYKAAVLKAAVEGRLVPTEAELARRESRSFESGLQLLERILAKRRNDWQGIGKYREPVEPRLQRQLPMPEGWALASIEQLNPAHRPCAYGVLQPGADADSGVPFVRVGDIDGGKVAVGSLKRISPSIAGRYPRTRLEGGELLITLVGAIGRTAVAPIVLRGANVARAVAVVPLMPEVEARWIEIWFRNPRKVAEMNRLAHEVARKTLNLEDVRRANVAIPPFAEQVRIGAETERIGSIVDEAEIETDKQIQRAHHLREAVLKRAFALWPGEGSLNCA